MFQYICAAFALIYMWYVCMEEEYLKLLNDKKIFSVKYRLIFVLCLKLNYNENVLL